MSIPFTLRLAVPAPPDPDMPEITYCPERQMNFTADGRPFIADREALMRSASTTSTAGSKTHWDD